MGRRTALTVLTTIVATLLIASAATAKGPTGATIEGPGLDTPITVEMGDELWALADRVGFSALMFGMPMVDGTPMKMAPSGDLGAAFVITFQLGDTNIPMIYHPFAELGPLADKAGSPHGPIVFIEDASVLSDTQRIQWYAPPATANDLLEGLGVPLTEKLSMAPTPDASTAAVAATSTGDAAAGVPVLPLAAVALTAVAMVGVVAIGRQRRTLAG